MALIVRRLMPVIVVLASVVALVTPWTLSAAAVALSANTTALIMGGTFHPLTGPRDTPDFVRDYLDGAVTRHLNPAFAGGSGAVTNAVAVFTPEDFFPIGRLTFEKSLAEGVLNLYRCIDAQADCVFNTDPALHATIAAPQVDDAMVVFGYSQSAAVASLVKRDLIADHQPGDPSVSFFLIANPMRPNGGVLMRLLGWPTIPILGIPFPGASPTDSIEDDDGGFASPTVDVVRQYDGLGGDFPVRPLNLFATINALMGYGLLHGETVDVPLSQARFQGREGDTSYYLIETDLVPLLQPFQLFIPKPILKAIDAPLRVIIEDAYDRDVGPGVPTRANWWPIKDPIGMALKFLASVPVAVDNFAEGFGLTRVLGTSRPGAFGVGSPDVAAQPDSEPLDTEDTVSEAIPTSRHRGAASPDTAAATGDEARHIARRDEDDVEPEKAASVPGSTADPDSDQDATPGDDDAASLADGDDAAPAEHTAATDTDESDTDESDADESDADATDQPDGDAADAA